MALQVPRTEDYPWLSTLLSKRVTKRDPNFELQLTRDIQRQLPAQVVLSPRQP
ncbi:hypothetical protein D9M73_249000 [compost metagenome]